MVVFQPRWPAASAAPVSGVTQPCSEAEQEMRASVRGLAGIFVVSVGPLHAAGTDFCRLATIWSIEPGDMTSPWMAFTISSGLVTCGTTTIGQSWLWFAPQLLFVPPVADEPPEDGVELLPQPARTRPSVSPEATVNHERCSLSLMLSPVNCWHGPGSARPVFRSDDPGRANCLSE